MADEPIFAELEAKAKQARHAIAADFEAGMEAGAESIARATERVFGHGHYHGAQVTETPKEPAMAFELSDLDPDKLIADLSSGAQDIEDKLAGLWNDAKQYGENHIPGAVAVLQAAKASPLVAAGLKIVHLSPEILSDAADGLLKLDAALGAAKAQGAAAAPTGAPAVAAEGDVAAQPADQTAAPAA